MTAGMTAGVLASARRLLAVMTAVTPAVMPAVMLTSVLTVMLTSRRRALASVSASSLRSLRAWHMSHGTMQRQLGAGASGSRFRKSLPEVASGSRFRKSLKIIRLPFESLFSLFHCALMF
jgi:hypothetical protein